MNFRLIAEQWDRIGQFYAAFPAGHATASAALQRLNRFQASNRFYAANRELGRALKTEFVLQYMSEPQLRAKVRRRLLKVEQLHALARAAYYGAAGAHQRPRGLRPGERVLVPSAGLPPCCYAIRRAMRDHGDKRTPAPSPPRRPAATAPGPSVRLGISSCLLGEAVRYDGGHKRDPYLVETLGRLVEWVPVCPEAELGLGTPREPIRLVRDAGQADGVRLVGRSGVRLTGGMRRFARSRVRALAKADLSGYVLKKDSPSCGMERVKVWTAATTRGRRSGTAAASSRPSCCASTRTSRSKRKAGCGTRRCARTSSSGCSPTGGCGPSSPRAGPSAASWAGTPRRNWP